jgi:hypothetical protein
VSGEEHLRQERSSRAVAEPWRPKVTIKATAKATGE